MTSADFRLCLFTLYGADWLTGFNADTGLSTRNIQRWSSGTNPIPDWMPTRLRECAVFRVPHMIKPINEVLEILELPKLVSAPHQS